MNVLQTDYSNLFAAGLRVIESRTTGRRSYEEEDFVGPSIELAPRKPSPFPTKLWHRLSGRRAESSSKIDGVAKPRWRSMLSGTLAAPETALDERIWDWSTRVYRATEEEEVGECVDPHRDDKVDPVDTPRPTRTAFVVALPDTSSEHGQHEQQHRRLSLHAPPHLRHTQKESTALELESYEESGIDDDWHQFRVEWIDFGVDGSR
jgi:hypothetical protein